MLDIFPSIILFNKKQNRTETIIVHRNAYVWVRDYFNFFSQSFPVYLFLCSKLMHTSINVLGEPLDRSVKSLRINFEPDK